MTKYCGPPLSRDPAGLGPCSAGLTPRSPPGPTSLLVLRVGPGRGQRGGRGEQAEPTGRGPAGPLGAAQPGPAGARAAQRGAVPGTARSAVGALRAEPAEPALRPRHGAVPQCRERRMGREHPAPAAAGAGTAARSGDPGVGCASLGCRAPAPHRAGRDPCCTQGFHRVPPFVPVRLRGFLGHRACGAGKHWGAGDWDHGGGRVPCCRQGPCRVWGCVSTPAPHHRMLSPGTQRGKVSPG